MQQSRCNQKYLPNAEFPDSLVVEANLEKAVSQSQDLLLAPPSFAFANLLEQIKPFLNKNHRIVWATKGLNPDNGSLLHEAVADILGDECPMAVLSGPTFAKEMVAGLPTAIACAANQEKFANDIAERLHCAKSFRVYKNNDIVGVQLGGAVKNVIAIGAGLADGLGFGANARTALITRGIAEISRLGIALGASAETFMGMAGLGDLVLTCTDNQSRNRRFGIALGEGKSVQEAIDEIGQVVEGYRNTKEVKLLSSRVQLEMPICEQIYQVLYSNKPAKEAAFDLLKREQKAE